ncbi:MAG: outer membrane beta-barrel protein [Bacteroidota bacterium]|jgi:outer membrane receptor protein involved in Fe transport
MAVSALQVRAQFPTGGRPPGAGGQNMNMGHLYGKIVDEKTGKGIDGATVQLIGNRFDSVTRKMKQAILKTQITKSKGDFSFENLSIFGNFQLKVSSLGYKAITQAVGFGMKMPPAGGNMQQMMGMIDKDLGNIKLTEDSTTLATVTVTSSAKPLLELGIDRKIFTVDKNLNSTGQTAAEVMKNIPSLNVDIDGNVTLRNAAPTLFVDGRPTTLTLDQIPADIIDKVELITNPSAKFDASGGTAGILNIVLKKNKKIGYNGGIRTGIDSRGKVNLGGDINLRQNKINLGLSANLNEFKSISSSSINRDNLQTFLPNKVNTFMNSVNEGQFKFFRGSLDIFLDNRNTITIAANYNRGRFESEQNQRVDSVIKQNFASYNLINNVSDRSFENLGTQLSFKHNFAKNGHNISADANFNSSNSNGASLIRIQTYTPEAFVKGNPLLQLNNSNGDNRFYTFQTDYENPLTDDSKLEAGLRAAIRDNSSINDQYRFNNNTGKYELVPAISTRYKFHDEVWAAYTTYSFKKGRFSYLLGLRAESSNYQGTLLNVNGQDSLNFKVEFPISLFPSIFSTYKLNDKQDLQLNYTRKINRPNFFQLMPFPDYSDPQNVNIGNAGLQPEFTNSFELSYNNTYKKNANFLASLYFKHTSNLITRYVYRDVNALIPGDSAYFSTFINANYSFATGVELTNKMAVSKSWDMTVNLNIFSSSLRADLPNEKFSNDLVSWFGKVINNFKLKKSWSIQLSGDYQARTVLPPGGGGMGGGRGGFGGGGGMMWGGGPQTTAQGYNLPRYGVDLAIRKDWTWKNGQTGSLTLSMNDIFKTQLFQSYSESAFFQQTSERRRDPQVLRVNFSYRFGKFDASLFKRKSTKSDPSSGMSDMMNQ